MPKDFESLYMWKVKNGLDKELVTSNYFFCYEDKILFIRRCRKYYAVCASSVCGFEPCHRLSIFDILYSSKDLDETILQFRSYVSRLLIAKD